MLSDRSSTLLASTTSEQAAYRLLRLIFISESALILLLLLSRPDPLRWAPVWRRPVGGCFSFLTEISILTALCTSEQAVYRLLRFFKSESAHADASPFQPRPASMGLRLRAPIGGFFVAGKISIFISTVTSPRASCCLQRVFCFPADTPRAHSVAPRFPIGSAWTYTRRGTGVYKLRGIRRRQKENCVKLGLQNFYILQIFGCFMGFY